MLSGSIKWIMIVSGVLTCTMVYAVIAPQAMLQSTFGETLGGPARAPHRAQLGSA